MSTKPAVTPNFHRCTVAPKNVYLAHSAKPHPNDPAWQFETWEEMGTDKLYYKIVPVATPHMHYWEYPVGIDCGGSFLPTAPSYSQQQTKKVQQALINAGYNLPAYGADGFWGAETCSAALQYCQEVLRVTPDGLGADFFTSLNLPAWYTNKFYDACTSAWGLAPDDPVPIVPDPPVEPDPPPAPPEKVSSGNVWLAPLVGALTGTAVGLGTRELAYKGADPLLAGGMGGMVGLISGLVWNGVRS